MNTTPTIKRNPIAEIGCESHLIDGHPFERIEDEPFEGSRPCDELAEWRVTFNGEATDFQGSALRMKCDDCAQSAIDCFGDDVTLRAL